MGDQAPLWEPKKDTPLRMDFSTYLLLSPTKAASMTAQELFVYTQTLLKENSFAGGMWRGPSGNPIKYFILTSLLNKILT
jgi:hypothetical protein